MKLEKISPNGMNRNLPDRTCPDGVCEEIINLRLKDGAWRPITPKVKVFDTPPYEKLFIHVMDEKTNYLGYDFDTRKLVYFNPYTGTVSQTIHTFSEYNTDIIFKQLGHILLFFIKDKMYRMIYRDSDDSYQYIGAEFPPLPKIAFGGIVEEIWDSETMSDLTDDSDEQTDLKKAIVGHYYKELNDHSLNKQYYEGFAFFRIAYELYDGTYVMHSQPIVARIVNESMTVTALHTSADLWAGLKFNQMAIGQFTGQFYLEPEIEASLTTEFKSIIKSIGIFMTQVRSNFEWDQAGFDYNNPDFMVTEVFGVDVMGILYENAPKTDKKTGYEDPNYYLVKNVSIDEFNGLSFFLELDDYESIIHNDILPVDDFTNHGISGEVPHVYNSRLLLANTVTTFSKGWDPYLLFMNQGNTATSMEGFIEYIITTDKGEAIVRSDTVTLDKDEFVTGPIIGYPDVRATKMRFFLKGVGSYYAYLQKEFSLSPHPSLNMALYHNDDYSQITFPRDLTQNIYIGSEQTSLKDANRIQVSEIYNPFLFPAKNSYQVGSNKVIGMANNTAPLSTGQFGEHPLIVFCEDGNYVMTQGNGEVLFTTITPLNREVCNNPNTIVALDHAVAYGSDNGMIILQGAEPKNISEVLDGLPATYLKDDADFQLFTQHPNLYDLLGSISAENFTEFLEHTDTIVGFNYDEKEILVSNSTLGYTYIFGLENGAWYKTSESFDQFLPNYPKLYAQRGDEYVDIWEEAEGYTSFHLQTRPIKLNGDVHKKLKQVILRGNFDLNTNKYLGFYLFASNDAQAWKLITGKQPTGKVVDLLLHRSHSSYKYYILMVGGDVLKNGELHSFVVNFDIKLTNKLR